MVEQVFSGRAESPCGCIAGLDARFVRRHALCVGVGGTHDGLGHGQGYRWFVGIIDTRRISHRWCSVRRHR